MLAVGDDELHTALSRLIKRGGVSRRRLFLADLARSKFERLRDFIAALPLLRVGYSIKTNPRRELLHEALRCEFYAECISGGEVAAALNAGFTPANVIYNGPVPATALTVQPKLVFADSIEAYTADCAALPDSIAGIRIRPPGVTSRFGVPLERLDDLVRAVREAGRSEIAVSFQVRSEDYGGNDFRGIAAATIGAASEIEAQSGACVVAFDAGGGRSAAEFDESVAAGDYHYVHDAVRMRLPHAREIVLEPGQELDFSLEAMIAPILEVRRDDRMQIVIDAGRPDVPAIEKSAHRLFFVRDGSPTLLSPGSGRILGRTCLEDDIIGTVALPTDACCDDAIVIADAGAYDSSMRFAFAQGYESGNTSL